MGPSQQLSEPLKLSTLIHVKEDNHIFALGVQSLRIPRGFPTSITPKKLTLEFHGFASQRNVHYSIDVITTLPRGVVDGWSSSDQATAQLNQLYDLEHAKLMKPEGEWFGNDSIAHYYIALTALPQRGVKLLARMNGRFTDNNEYCCEVVDFEQSRKDTASNANSGPPTPPIVTVEDEFIVVVRFASFRGSVESVSGVIGLEVS